MELGKQIKKYRSELNISQEILAEKVYVSRQTISNWENGKSYPDVNSLIRLSEVFSISIDILIKGDIEKMKEQINEEDREQFNRLSKIFTTLFFATMLMPIPLVYFGGYIGFALWVILFAVTMYFAILVEKKKKQFDVQTYKEIIAFTEGQGLDEIAKAKEEGKRPYQKAMLAILSAIVTFIVSFLMILIF